MEGDRVELPRPVLQLHLAVLVPEELGIGKTRGDDLVVAGDDGLAAVAGDHVGDQQIAIGQTSGPRVAQAEAFLVVLDRGDDHLGRHGEEALVEASHEHHGPFDQARHFLQEALVLDHLEALREGEVAGLGADRLGAGVGVNDHEVLVELLGIVFEAADLDPLAAHESVATGDIAARNAIDREWHHLAIEGADDRMKRAHPAQVSRTPAHGLGPGELADHVGQNLGDDGGGVAAFLAHHSEIELALLVVLDLQLTETQAGRLEEAVDGRLGRVDARALALFDDVRRAGIEALDGQHQAAGAAVGLCAIIGEAGIDQRIRHQAAKIVRRLLLHAGGNFLGEQFDQEFGHQRLLWVPSQNGLFRVFLQAQKNLRPAASAVHFCGANSVPLCEPSQKGWRFDWPQAHHQ